ncbi:MAG: DMT family transporter [Bacteroidetes bacterium]|nr:MAG: DMT family transporter [Bacteroidota bacterium]
MLTTKSQSATIAPWQAWGVLILLSFIWGTSYVLIKWGLIYFPPTQVASIRLGVSALAFAPLFVRHLQKVDRQQLGTLLLVGITGTGLPSVLFPLAQAHISSSLAGVLSSLSPLFTLLLGLLFFGAGFSWSKTGGILIGLVGAVCLVWWQQDGELAGDWRYSLLPILACLCYAASSNLVGFHLRELSALTISVVSFTLVGIPALFYLLLLTDFIPLLQTTPAAWRGLGWITLLALFSTVLAGILFYRLIQWTSPVFGSTVSYLVPAVAMSWGFLDGEVVSWGHFLGLGLIMTGIYWSRQD